MPSGARSKVAVFMLALSAASSAIAQAVDAPPRYRMTAGALSQEFAWAGDEDLAKKLALLDGTKPATIDFAPGVFEFRQGINLPGARNLHFRGQPGTTFRLRKLEEWGRILTVGETQADDKVLRVDHPELLRAGARYQLFHADQRGNRFLECVVASIEGDAARLSWSSVTHPDLRAIPAGSYVLPEINFFDTFRGGGLSFRDILFDGNCKIDEMQIAGKAFYGHTTHCGIVVRNQYRAPESRPSTHDVTIERCRFGNLLGRGIAIYNVSGITIRDCTFEDVRTEAAEIDHWSQDARILNCRFVRCGTAVQLNDCNEVIVSSCRIASCDLGLRVLDSLEDRNTNRSLIVSDNFFTQDKKAILTDPHSDENVFRGNVFRDCGKIAVTLGGDRNTFVSNVVEGSSTVGVEILGTGCIVATNQIIPR